MTNLNSGLRDWKPEWIANWHEWVQHFEKATRIDEKLGLLRIGFSVSMERTEYGEPDYISGDRICYYLRLADGHCYFRNMHGESDGEISPHHAKLRTPHGKVDELSELRLLVSRAAFDVLAINFFKSKDRDSHDRCLDWTRAIFKGNVLRELMFFFRIAPKQSTSRPTLINFPDEHYGGNKHNGKLARQFLDELIRFAWEFRYFGEREDSQDKDYRRQLDRIKPHLVRIMAYTGRIWWLLRPEFPINDLCIRILERSALTWKMRRHMPIHYSERRRKAVTIEEAAADGCQTAEVILLLKNRERERARLEEIRDAILDAENSDRRLEVLRR